MNERRLRQELRAKYNSPQREREWTQDWDEYDVIVADRAVAMSDEAFEHLSIRAQYHNVGPVCVCEFIHETMSWWKPVKAGRAYSKGANKSRSWIRYHAFSSNGPPREAVARRLERLHWLAGLEPPSWEQIRTKEDAVRSIEAFRSLRCDTKMHNGANFNPTCWGSNTPWPICNACSERGEHCYSKK